MTKTMKMAKTTKTTNGTHALAGIVLALLAAAIGAGCGDDHGHDHSYPNGHSTALPACTAITEACHVVDVGDGPIHDCHDLAHEATTEDACTQKKAECLALCNAANADGGGAADASGQ